MAFNLREKRGDQGSVSVREDLHAFSVSRPMQISFIFDSKLDGLVFPNKNLDLTDIQHSWIFFNHLTRSCGTTRKAGSLGSAVSS